MKTTQLHSGKFHFFQKHTLIDKELNIKYLVVDLFGKCTVFFYNVFKLWSIPFKIKWSIANKFLEVVEDKYCL